MRQAVVELGRQALRPALEAPGEPFGDVVDLVVGVGTVGVPRAATEVGTDALAPHVQILLRGDEAPPERLAGRFVRRAQGLTAELDYRLTHSLLPSVRYDWMKAGGFQSDVIFEPGPRQSQVLHLQMRWYLFEGDNLARVPIPALLVLSLRDSVNLTPGGSHPFGAWRNAVLLGFDFAF